MLLGIVMDKIFDTHKIKLIATTSRVFPTINIILYVQMSFVGPSHNVKSSTLYLLQ